MTLDPDRNFAAETDDQVRQARRRQAYQDLFGSPLGRVVLADILREGGVGARKGPPNGVAGHRDYQAGWEDRSIEIMELAALSQEAAVTQAIHETEGYYDDRHQFEPE